jgi:hypothetical protein
LECKLPKGFWKSLAEKDWNGPVSDLVYTVFLLVKDGVEILALMGIALSVKALLGLMEVPPLVVFGVEIQAAQVVKNFDYMLLLMFLGVQSFRLLKSMIKS